MNPATSDIAGSLFTNQYRSTKLAGQPAPPTDLNGTGCVSGVF